MLASPYIDLPFYIVLGFWAAVSVTVLYVSGRPLYAAAAVTFGGWASGLLLGSAEAVVRLALVVLFHQALIAVSLRAAKAGKNGKHFKAIFVILYSLALLPVLLIKAHVFSLIAVSYITFRTMQILFDVHDGRLASIEPMSLLIFISFFPTAFAGPVDRYERFNADLRARLSRDELRRRVECGAKNLWFGLFYKFICAHYVGLWLSGLDRETLGVALFRLVRLYLNGANIILDIAGFSAIAIAFSCFAGIRTPRNVDKPLLSLSLREFWQRCQITLAQWFRDYVFMRLLLYIRRRKLLASTELAAYVSIIITFTLLGAWHGFTYAYIFYGLYNGVLLAAQEWLDFARKRGKFTLELPKFLKWLVTFHVVMLGLHIFTR
jgi:membrane protein involved in D-alanine export